MTGSTFDNHSTDPTAMLGLNNLTLVFEGGPTDLDPFEVAGRDLGESLDGFNLNFSLDTLQIGGNNVGRIQLVDLFDNQTDSPDTEVIYVENLIIYLGSYLDLNGLTLYYKNAVIFDVNSIDYNGGQLIQIPEPTSLAILGSFAMALLSRRDL